MITVEEGAEREEPEALEDHMKIVFYTKHGSYTYELTAVIPAWTEPAQT